jgi:hypothetical protein
MSLLYKLKQDVEMCGKVDICIYSLVGNLDRRNGLGIGVYESKILI